MPWQGVTPVDLRAEFTRAFTAGWFSMTELCDQYGISRKTGYKWVDRYEAEGRAGLVDRSRRPHHSPRATSARVVELLCEARRRHPTWSARKLIAVLRGHHPRLPWPARSTGCALLKAHGLVRARRRRVRARAASAPLAPITHPNEVWTADFKGEFRTGDRRYCYPLTVRDGFSRYVLRCDALPTKGTASTRDRFERAFRDYGVPARIRSDNGEPFAGTGLTRLSRLSAWWIRLGIQPERIALGHPEQNGSHEQFHRVLKAETARPPAPSLAAQQRRFRHFCTEYNEERPHEALHDQPPASCYTPSPRPFPARLPPLEYPGHMEIRRVSPFGQVSWAGRGLYLTEVLGGEYVAFDEVEDGIWMLYFATVRLARFDERTRTLTALPHATS
ncbi:MAG TPA: IS481 family transposase [Rhodothermales bacterium]